MRRVPRSPGATGGAVRGSILALALATALAPAPAAATPTTLFWAPSPRVQPFALPHLTFDTYFFPGSSKTTSYPETIGLTMGVIPSEKVQLEVGFDALVPTRAPLFLNAKLGTPEEAWFAGSPALAIGLYQAGVTATSSLDVFYAVAGKTTPVGMFELGGYAGSERLLRSSSGALHRSGVLAGFAAPPIPVGRPWLQRIDFRWDLVTGKNPIGATGGGLAFVFAPSVSMLTGPIFFFDPALQPAGTSWLWSVQLGVDLGTPPKARAAVSAQSL